MLCRKQAILKSWEKYFPSFNNVHLDCIMTCLCEDHLPTPCLFITHAGSPRNLEYTIL